MRTQKLRHESAEALYRHEVSLRTVEDYLLLPDDPLPRAELNGWKLHPYEVFIFEIDPPLYPKLITAHRWYSGAIAEAAHDDYWDFREQEQTRWARFVTRQDGKPVFDRSACLGFMHEATGLPLRQCEAVIQKLMATELRSGVAWFRDERNDRDEGQSVGGTE